MPKNKRHDYTEFELDFIATNKEMNRIDLTILFNNKFSSSLSVEQINSLCKRKGWKTGRNGQFRKGSKPWNAGTTGATKRNVTSFKKGQTPLNLKPLGHERICSKDGHVLVKVAEPNPYTQAQTRYRPKHQVEWEKVNGSIPKGWVIRFLDNDKKNCDLENLVCVSKSVNLRMNLLNVSEMPDELKPTGRMLAELQVETFDAQKKAE